MNPYKVLGVAANANTDEIKLAYRKLVKKHHPDTGGDQNTILSLNAAWEILGDKENRKLFDLGRKGFHSSKKEAQARTVRNVRATNEAQNIQGKSAAAEHALSYWLKDIYTPIDKLLGQVINPFNNQLKTLSADPYDDRLMDNFCCYLETSKKILEKIKTIYSSKETPLLAKEFSLNLYHCLSLVQDALDEIERYTMGYVDNYLHDGNEMLREAKKRRMNLKKEIPRF